LKSILNYETPNFKIQLADSGFEIKRPCYQILNKETGVVEYEGTILVNCFRICDALQNYYDIIIEHLNRNDENTEINIPGIDLNAFEFDIERAN
jgi:hypothetical protein